MISFDNSKKKVAKERGWSKLVTGHQSKYFDQAAELYVNELLNEFISFCKKKDVLITEEIIGEFKEKRLL